jgi:release factor glutamine methyltransferase
VITSVPTAAELIETLAARFEGAGVTTPRSDARWLVLHVLGWSAVDLVLSGDRPLSDDQWRAVRRLAERRAAREPLQLVLGGTQFRGHDLEVRHGVFIPRPETELLVDLALRDLPSRGVVVDLCTGSGAVACAIAAERPDARVVATDIDVAATELAAANATRLDVRVDVRRGWLLDPVQDELRGQIDVLVANPPYLAEGEVRGLDPEVADWDPPAALVAGATGHEVSDLLWAAAGEWLRPGGWIGLELDERRVDDAARRAAAAGLAAVAGHRDLAGRPRFVSARRPA